jgi:5-methylcytosine-specific restriction endonuclease McrA
MSRPHGSAGRSTASFKRLAREILRASDICWLCGNGGADTVDHVVPLAVAPQLAEVRSNLKPAHGKKRTLEADGFDCPGNYGRGNWTPVENLSEDW